MFIVFDPDSRGSTFARHYSPVTAVSLPLPLTMVFYTRRLSSANVCAQSPSSRHSAIAVNFHRCFTGDYFACNHRYSSSYVCASQLLDGQALRESMCDARRRASLLLYIRYPQSMRGSHDTCQLPQSKSATAYSVRTLYVGYRGRTNNSRGNDTNNDFNNFIILIQHRPGVRCNAHQKYSHAAACHAEQAYHGAYKYIYVNFIISSYYCKIRLIILYVIRKTLNINLSQKNDEIKIALIIIILANALSK